MLVQYRLYSDPEYNARNKAARREKPTRADALHQPELRRKQATDDGAAPKPPLEQEAPVKESGYTLWNAITSSYTWIPVSPAGFRAGLLVLRQRSVPVVDSAKQFIVVLLTWFLWESRLFTERG